VEVEQKVLARVVAFLEVTAFVLRLLVFVGYHMTI
jgi:hypothetical protein